MDDVPSPGGVADAISTDELNRRLRTLFDSMNEAFYLVELIRDEAGAVVDLLYLEENPAAVGAVGATAKGRRLSAVNEDFDREWLAIVDRVARSGESERFDRYSPVTGRWHDFKVFASVQQDQVGVLSSDITGRKRNEEALAESEEKYRSLFESIDEGFALCEMIADESGRLSDFRYIDVNPAFEAITGLPVGETIGRRLSELLPPPYDDWVAIYEQVVRTGASLRFERYLIPLNRWLSVYCFPRGGLRFAAIFSDITEPKNAEIALRDSEEKYRTLFESIDEGFTIMEAVRDDRGRVVDVIYHQANQAWVRLFGFEIELGRKASEVFSYPADAPWIETWNQVLDTGEPIREEQYIEATDRWYNVRFSRIGGAGSDLIAAVFDDITERKRAEIALRESEVRLAAELQSAKALQATSGLLIKEGESKRLFELIVDTAMSIMKADFGSIQLMDLGRGELQLIASRNFSPEAEAYWQRVSVTTASTCGSALSHGERVIIENVATDERTRSSDNMRYWKSSGIAAVQSTPLTARDGTIIGMISTHWREPHTPDERELRLFDVLARQAADSIERTRAEQALRESEELRRIALQSGSMGAWTWDLREHIVRADEVVQKLWGVSSADQPHPVSLYEDRMDPDAVAWLAGVRHQELAPGQQVDTQMQVARGPTAGRWVHLRGRADAERPWIINGVSYDVTDQRLAEQQLRESEEKYAGLFSASPAPFLILKPDAPRFTIADVNDAYLAATMRTREDLVGCAMFDAFPDNPDDPLANGVSNLRASLERALVSRRFDLMDIQKYDIVRPDGTFEERWWKPANAPVVDINGNVVAIIHHVADVTAEHRAVEGLRASERHAQTLLAELQHRVRNTLAVVRSIARRTAENSRSVEEMLAHFQGRLDAFSRVQAALTRSPNATVGFKSLIDDELVAHATHEGGQVKLDGPDLELDPRSAERLSLAVHELTTNAVKHGALGSDGGRIRVSWKVARNDDGRELAFHWKESGVRLDGAKPEREGFGMELLLRSLPYDVNGQTKVELGSKGLSFTLHMPLPDAAITK